VAVKHDELPEAFLYVDQPCVQLADNLCALLVKFGESDLMLKRHYLKRVLESFIGCIGITFKAHFEGLNLTGQMPRY